MEQLNIFGSETHEYLFVIEPDQKTADKLIQLRILLNTFISLQEETLHSKPHISVCYFQASNFSDELIISKAEQLISSIKSFDIALNGCEKWKNGTFILKVMQDEYIHQLQKELSKVFKGVIKTPHLTITRNLSEQFLNQLTLDAFQYYGGFTCESILLLKRNKTEPYHVLDKILLSKK